MSYASSLLTLWCLITCCLCTVFAAHPDLVAVDGVGLKQVLHKRHEHEISTNNLAFWSENCPAQASGLSSCVPLDTNLGTLFRAKVLNRGVATAHRFAISFFISRRVPSDGTHCVFDAQFPLRDAVEIHKIWVDSLAPNASVTVDSDGARIPSWVASQLRHGRSNMLRCLFVYPDSTNRLYSTRFDERTVIAATVIKLVDLVDLRLGTFRYQAETRPVQLPWAAIPIQNYGLVPVHNVVIAILITQVSPHMPLGCPAMTDFEHPLGPFDEAEVLGIRTIDIIYPNQEVLVVPQLQTPPSNASRSWVGNGAVCMWLVVDPDNKIYEPQDGRSNVARAIATHQQLLKYVVTHSLRSQPSVHERPPWLHNTNEWAFHTTFPG